MLGTHSTIPQSSVSGTTAKVRRQRFRLRLAESFARSRFMTEANSMSRASFRRSSFGLNRKMYFRPSLPTIVTFFGRCRDESRSTWFSSDWIVTAHVSLKGLTCSPLHPALSPSPLENDGVRAACTGTSMLIGSIRRSAPSCDASDSLKLSWRLFPTS